MTFRHRLRNLAPGLARPKRYLRALVDSRRPVRRSYSQHGEDRWLLDHLGGSIPPGSAFIDVGAHHPSDGSNTYLFHRLGARGVLVEPNLELVPLLRRFRAGDVVFPVGCGRSATTRRYLRYSAAANSSFAETRMALNEREKGFRRVSEDHAPVLPLDTIARAVTGDRILLLSIDVEGLEDEVLDGGAETLARTDHIIIEALSTNPGMEELIDERLTGSGFQRVHSIAYNRFYSRRSP